MTAPFRLFDLVGEAAHINRLQAVLVSETMDRIARFHPAYRELMRREGIRPGDFDSVESLESFPLTSKADFVGAPERFRMETDPEHPDDYVLWDVAYTSGTSTGRPTPMYQTAHDFRALMLAQRRMAEIRGMDASDRIVNLYPITALPHGAWLRCNQAAAAIGAALTAGMSGRQVGGFPVVRDTEEVVALTVSADPTVLWGVPSYVRRVLQAVVDNGHHLPSLRMVAVSGEPCGQGMRQSINDLAGQAGADDRFVVSDSLGATELQCGLVECVPGTGFHNPAPELFHLSAVNAEGFAAADGEQGRLVLTHLDRRGTVLVRFILGDRVELTNEACPSCGRGGGRVIAHLGRSGSHTKIRGNLVDLGEVSTAIARVPHVVEHQLVISRPEGDALGLDEFAVRVVVDDAADADSVTSKIQRAIAVSARMDAAVDIVDRAAIWSDGPDMKPPRILDTRHDA